MNKIILSSVLVAMLCACGITKKSLGIEKEAPDEMLVVSRSPLSIPPEFGLRPVISDSDLAEEKTSLSAGEQALLNKLKE